MSKGNQRFAEFIVKFPSVTPKSHEKVDAYDDYCRVEGFSEANNMPRSLEPRPDGERPIQDPLPVTIALEPGLMARLLPLITKGQLDDDIQFIQLALRKGKPTKSFEQKLKGCVLSSTGGNSVLVMYKEFERKRYNEGDATDEYGFNFQDQEVTVS